MIEKIKQAEEVRQQLLAEIASMKKQSLGSLIFAVVCIVAMVYFYAELRESNDNLRVAKQELQKKDRVLQAQKKLLQQQNIELEASKKAMDDWRIEQMDKHRRQQSTKAAALAPISPPREATPPVLLASLSPSAGVTGSTGRRLIYYQPFASAAARPVGRLARSRRIANPATSPFYGYIIHIKDARLTKDAKKNRALGALQKKLKDAGAIVPGVRAVKSTRTVVTCVKYFHAPDRKSAHEAAKLLSSLLGDTVGVVQEAKPQLSRGQLEVWIGDKLK